MASTPTPPSYRPADNAEVAADADTSLQPAPSPLPSSPGDDLISPNPVKDGPGDKPSVKAAVRRARETVRTEASGLKQRATDKAQALADQGKTVATDRLDDLSRMIDDAASQVDEKLGEDYGRYARNAAGSVAEFAERLRDKDVEDLVEDTREFVRKSPMVAIGAAAALGFVLARLVKSGLEAPDTEPRA